MIRKHVDFDLWVGLDDVKARCRGKDARAEVRLAPFANEMEELARALRDDPEQQISVSDLGKRLYDAVFVEQVRDLMAVNLPEWGTERGLRLRLRLHRKVSGWLWELLHTRGSFLAMSVKTPVVRDVDGKPLPVLRTAWPIRVLVVEPKPPGFPELEAGQEVTDIHKALGWRERLGLVRIEKLEPPTLSALLGLLNARRYHVLHFIGHGRLSQDGKKGELLFEDLSGQANWVEGEKLAPLLADDDKDSLRLVVLNACQSAQGTIDNVAGSLAKKGIPAVIGMQHPISDEVALAFSQQFYGALARARPVDWALARARQEMLAVGTGLDWAIPALFLSSTDGKIFRWKPSRGLLGAFGMVLLMLLLYGGWQSKATALESGLPFHPVTSYCPGPKSVEMEFVRIHPQSFLMGLDSGEDNEQPVHEVTISRPFCIGKFEVTQEQWKMVMGANSVESRLQGDDYPVTMVTFEDVKVFIRQLNKLEGRPIYRLATEAEWELAARGEGGGFNCLHDLYSDLQPVGTLPPNSRGLHDMLGNAWEWVSDWEGPYLTEPVRDPAGPETGTRRIKRGGSYRSADQHCRPSRRNSEEPDDRANDLGFRIVREIQLSPKER